MRRGGLILWVWAIAAVVTAFAAPAVYADGLTREATISLGRDPEPPFCVNNPGGTVEITWNIEYATTPLQVKFRIEDPTRTIVLDQQDYSGSTGVNITRYWTVPNGLVDGKYWVRVEYWSLESGNEANAEVTFYVCTGVGSVCAQKFIDIDCDEELTAADPVGSDWWICLDTPYEETYCLRTDAQGMACWNNIALGDYTVWEVDSTGWRPIYPSSSDVTVVNGETASVTFFNSECQPPSACCFPDGHCEVLAVGTCVEAGGTVYAEPSCDPNPCLQPESACCLPLDETCYTLDEQTCLQGGGIWYDGMMCSTAGGDIECPLWRVCCVDEDCYVVTMEDCAELNGEWHPEWESCEPDNPCEIPVPAAPDSWGSIKSVYR